MVERNDLMVLFVRPLHQNIENSIPTSLQNGDTMKYVSIVMLVCFCFLFVGCDSNKPAPSPDPEPEEPTPTTFTYEKDNATYLVIEGYEMLLVNKQFAVPETYGDGVDPVAQQALNSMLSAARADGFSIWVVSGFRSFDKQRRLFDGYVARDGEAAASRYSARPGHSEHQTGLAFDLASDSETTLKESFKNTPEGMWLAANAADHGFILRYPENAEWATGYIFEPWHFRYIGVELAKIIFESGLSVEEYAGLA